MKTTQEGRDKTRKFIACGDSRPLSTRFILALLDDADELARLREGLKQILREGEHSQATHDKIYMLLNREDSEHA